MDQRAYPSRWRYTNSNCNAKPNAYTYFNRNVDGDAYNDGDIHPYGNTEADADAEDSANAETESYASTAPVEPVGSIATRGAS